MKKIIYSGITKFIAILLIIVCAVQCMNVVMDGLVEYGNLGDRFIYNFEDDFSESSYFSSLLSSTESSLYEAYVHFYNDSKGIGDSTDESDLDIVDSGEEVIPSYQTVEDYVAQSLEKIYSYDKINYFVQINDKVFTNCGAQSKEELLDDRFYLLSERDSDGRTSYGSSARLYYGYYLDSDTYFGGDTITVCTSIKDSYVSECETIWYMQAEQIQEIFSQAVGFVLIILLLIIYLIAAVGKTKDNGYKLMWLDSIWTEIHLFIIVFAFGCALGVSLIMLEELYYGYLPLYIGKTVILALVAVGMLLILTSLLSVIRKIKCKKFIEGSVICIIVKWAWKIFVIVCRYVYKFLSTVCIYIYRKTKGFFKAISTLFSKKSGVILISMLLIYTAVIALLTVGTIISPAWLVLAIIVFGFACFVIAWRAKDLDEIKHGAGEVRRGNLTYKIPEIKSEDLKILADDVNEIAVGLDKSVSAKLKAERLKTDLITNVSHDLKTPLTSIISYTELLSKVEDLPEEAKDYVQIIAKKSDRLKNLTQDLFDISKVQSGNENIVFEKLDIALLINQSLGEHDSEIQKSELQFCVDVEKELFVSADGRKMSRVMSNLISNVLKYTMKNTRVFIFAFERDNEVIVEFKNIASYPINFDAEEIIGRFVRGDEARTAEGNGLGLAIARGYTEACNGKFNVIIDGDMFKAIIKFNKY